MNMKTTFDLLEEMRPIVYEMKRVVKQLHTN